MDLNFSTSEIGYGAGRDSATHFFTPASNTEVVHDRIGTCKLGPDYRLRTQLWTSGDWSPGQDTIRDLRILGGGDPNLSGRTVPYAVDALESDPLEALRQLVDLIVETGSSHVDGDVTAVATRYGGAGYPDGWTLDDSTYGYGAPVSSLSLNDNSVAVIIRPTEAGELADLELRPSLSHFVVQNHVLTENSDSSISSSRGSQEQTS